MCVIQLTQPAEPTILVSLRDSGFDEDSATGAGAGASDFTFCFNKPTNKPDRLEGKHASQTA